MSDFALWTMAMVLAVIWFASIGTRVLISPDEGRYATLALEMMRSGDWVTPRLNGLLYFEKPPLQYWIGALSFKLLGVTEFAARLWPAMAGFLTVILVGFTGARLCDRETGIRSAAIAASMAWVIGNSHFLTLDAGLTLFMTLSLSSVLIAQFATPEAGQHRTWIWIAWAAMAGAVLSKGLIGVLIPGAVLFLASLWRRDFRLWREMHWVSGLLIFFLLAAPWFVLVSMRNPGFAKFFFVHEHFARYLTTTHQREGAWWYYLPLLAGGLVPWVGGLPWLLRKSVSSTATRGIDINDLLIVWVAFILVFFSASGSKLPSYILPAFPALALMLAMQLGRTGIAALRWHLLVPTLLGVLALVASTQVGRFVSPETPVDALTHFVVALRVGASALLVGTAAAWWSLGVKRLTAAVVGLALGALIAWTTLMQAHDAFGQFKSAARLSAVLLPQIDASTPVFSVGSYDQTLPFYLRRNVVLVDYVDEFELGQRHEPGESLGTLNEFVDRWQMLPKAAAYMTPDTYTGLLQRGLPMRIVFQDFRRIVVVKP
jgi:4-amino-4-deoxy-L-arabinose transferase-like glycosyltransferase